MNYMLGHGHYKAATHTTILEVNIQRYMFDDQMNQIMECGKAMCHSPVITWMKICNSHILYQCNFAMHIKLHNFIFICVFPFADSSKTQHPSSFDSLQENYTLLNIQICIHTPCSTASGVGWFKHWTSEKWHQVAWNVQQNAVADSGHGSFLSAFLQIMAM